MLRNGLLFNSSQIKKKMNDMIFQLKEMNMIISKGFFVHFIMTYLRIQFDLSKIDYNTKRK